MSIDVSNFNLVHKREVLKDLNTKKDKLYKIGWTKNSVLVPSVSVYLAMMENVSVNPEKTRTYNPVLLPAFNN